MPESSSSRARCLIGRLLAALSATTFGGCSSASTRATVSAGEASAGQRPHGPPGVPAPGPHHDTTEAHPGSVGAHHGHGAGHHGFTDAQAWAPVFDDPARDAWQRPGDVLRALELSPAMRVADIGAGTGYFAVRLARAVPAGEVIATDIEPDMVRYLNERARREGLPNLRAVRATHAASGLTADSVDRILIVHVWHHLDDRVAYARELAAALKPGGKLFIVEFALAAKRGPPANLRLAPETLVAELEAAGLRAKLSPVALPEQYLVEAARPPSSQLGFFERPGRRP